MLVSCQNLICFVVFFSAVWTWRVNLTENANCKQQVDFFFFQNTRIFFQILMCTLWLKSQRFRTDFRTQTEVSIYKILKTIRTKITTCFRISLKPSGPTKNKSHSLGKAKSVTEFANIFIRNCHRFFFQQCSQAEL